MFVMQTKRFSSRRRMLIINADDFGCESSIDEGILQLWKHGKIMSLSVIVNQSNSRQAVQKIIKVKETSLLLYQETSIGLHFNLTRGKALSQTMKKSGLVENGQFVKQSLMKEVYKPHSIPEEAIRDELIAQIQLFIRLFKRRPSHLDSHNYLHIFPHLARIIAPIIQNFGIYRIRNIQMGNILDSYKKYQIDFRQSTEVYQKHKILSSDIILGHQDAGNLSVNKIRAAFDLHLKIKDHVSVQLMCHPGYPSIKKGSWMGKEDRLLQKQQLQGQQFAVLQQEIGGLSSYFNLFTPTTKTRHNRLLIYSKLVNGTGNLTTAIRLKSIFQRLGYQVYTWSVQNELDFHVQVEDLSKFLYGFSISLIIGINVSRSAHIIHEAVFSKKRICIQVPYILMIAGTDANISFKNYDKLVQFKDSLAECQCLISLSQSMAQITVEALKRLKIDKNVYTITQSSEVPTYLSQSLMKGSSMSKPYILFPTSFRKMKDPEHVLSQLNTIIELYDFQVIIIGPVLEHDYYEGIKAKLRKIKYLGIISRENCAQLMKSAFLVINTSIDQGMSCSILQAFSFKTPLLARNNSGNNQLIKHNINGLLYTQPAQFLVSFSLLLQNPSLRQRLVDQAFKIFNEKNSLQQQVKKYKNMLDIQITSNTMIKQYGNQLIKVFTQHFVHHTSDINNSLFLQIEPPVKPQMNILDLGCGTGIFSLMFLVKANQSSINLYLSDINTHILGNAIYNYRQSCLKHSINYVFLQESDLFEHLDSKIHFDVILFNPPQTPFQNEYSRSDKNGGRDSIKYFEPVFRHLSTLTNKFTFYLLHSYMAWPSKCSQLLQTYKLSIQWKSKAGIHSIHKEAYDMMQQKLSQFILEHWRQGRAEIEFKDDIFYIPAQIYSIEKCHF